MKTTSSAADIQMVTFLLSSEEYGVDVMDVREIVDWTDVTKVANAPSHVEGVIDLRGSIVPIVSLKKRFGLPDVAAGESNCIAVMDFAGSLTGFVIDEVTDVIRVARRDILPPAGGWVGALDGRDPVAGTKARRGHESEAFSLRSTPWRQKATTGWPCRTRWSFSGL